MKPCTTPSSIGDDRLAEQLGALAHPVRLRILRSLACRQRSCCKDVVAELPLAQSTVSQHLKVLAKAGLVTMDRQRPHTHYMIDRPALTALGLHLGAFAASCCPPSAEPGPASPLPSKDPPIV